jgi:hypothetical protein
MTFSSLTMKKPKKNRVNRQRRSCDQVIFEIFFTFFLVQREKRLKTLVYYFFGNYSALYSKSCSLTRVSKVKKLEKKK